MEYEIFFIINSLGIALIVLIGLYHLIGTFSENLFGFFCNSFNFSLFCLGVKDEGNKED